MFTVRGWIWDLVLAVALFSSGTALAQVLYVDVNSTNATPPYTDWTTAATNIQDAVDAAMAGDEIVVTNGTYATGGRAGSRVAVHKPLQVRSVNGPELTSIVGSKAFSLIRCVYLTNGASLSGFTLANGGAYTGSGLWCESRTAVVSNCVIRNNGGRFNSLGGQGCQYGGGVFGGTLNSCTLNGNSVSVSHSFLGDGYVAGGGAYNCTLNNCTLIGNSAVPDSYSQCDYWCYTGGVPFCCHTSVRYTRAYGGGAYNCTLNNCTLTGNTYSGASYCALANCIILDGASDSSRLNRCWTSDPLFVDRDSGNLRLQSNSPCINAGWNAFAPAGVDLDGNPRIAGGTVDLGAHEYQSPVSTVSYAWLQQFNLPIGPSVDSADPDGDGVNNYHEWLAGSDPTNPFSSPAQLTIIPSGAPPSGIILTWSTNAVGFTLQTTTNPGSPVWTNSLAPVIVNGQNTVTNPLSGARQFYRLIQ